MLFFAAIETSKLDLGTMFKGSPLIYSALLALSLFSFAIWLYSLMTLKQTNLVPSDFVRNVRSQLLERKFDAAYMTCQNGKLLLGNIIASGLIARKHGYQMMIEAMQAEGRRSGTALWQRISLLNDIAVVAPMLGLLGTVLGLFLAFYDINRGPDTMISIFDGLGLAIGTTVAGLIVALFAMIFYTVLKFRVVKLLSRLENEANSLGNLIEPL